MTILALEFSSPQRSVAVVQGQGRDSSVDQTQPLAPRPSPLAPRPSLHAPCLSETVETGSLADGTFEMVENTLREARLEREQIDCLAIGLGPGSYTGIRSAIAVGQGWQLARSNVKVIGINALECLAAQARADGIEGLAAIVIDAQRGEFYLAGYEITATGWRETVPVRLASRVDVEKCQTQGALLIGPEVTNWFPKGRTVFPRAAMLARLALTRNNFQPAETLQPLYLRQTAFVKAPKACGPDSADWRPPSKNSDPNST